MSGIPVQDEFNPMGDYFLIRSKYIDADGVRLDKVINQVKDDISKIKTDSYTKQQADDKFATKTDVYTKSEVDTALSNKVSVQSGYGLISDTDKAQIQTNKANITAAETAIAGKASTESVTQLQTDMAVQEARMDQLVGTVPPGSADEIADARVMIDGKTSQNLGDAIRTQVSSLKETIGKIKSHIEESHSFIKSDNFTENAIWEGTKITTGIGGHCALEPFEIVKGKTYYFSLVHDSFSYIAWEDGSITKLGNAGNPSWSGSKNAAQNGVAYVTFLKGNINNGAYITDYRVVSKSRIPKSDGFYIEKKLYSLNEIKKVGRKMEFTKRPNSGANVDEETIVIPSGNTGADTMFINTISGGEGKHCVIAINYLCNIQTENFDALFDICVTDGDIVNRYQADSEIIFNEADGSNTKVFALTLPDNTPPTVIFNVLNSKVVDSTVAIRVRGYYLLDGCADSLLVTQEKISKNGNLFDFEKYNLPVLRLSGNIEGMSKDVKKTLSYVYSNGWTGTCTLKWQGSSSIAYPKKNYTITFDNNYVFDKNEKWGAHKKYCLKANYIDFSHARNLVSAKIWGLMYKTRTNRDVRLVDLPNCGAVDGFPIMLVINGEYQGLYTFNIPKDGWMFGMTGTDTEWIVSAASYSFNDLPKVDGTDLEIEYKSDSVDDSVIKSSLINLASKVLNCDTLAKFEELKSYIDIESVIDYYLFITLVGGADNAGRNWLLSTFDGVKWFMTAYDLDSTYGNKPDGKGYYYINVDPNITSYANTNTLIRLVKTYAKQDIKDRFNVIRYNPLSVTYVQYLFSNFFAEIPKAIKDAECRIWSEIPATDVNNYSQIVEFYRDRFEYIKNEINSL